jgi:hypothetical protein
MRWINYAFGLYFFISAIKAITKGKKKILVGTVENSEAIMNVSNEAFMADAFFKKPLYHQRFQLTDIMDMISSQSSAYLIITAPKVPSPTTTSTTKTTSTVITGTGDIMTKTKVSYNTRTEHNSNYKPDTSTGEIQSSGHRNDYKPSDKDYNDTFDYKDNQNYADSFDYNEDFKEDEVNNIKSLSSNSIAYNATENIAGCCYLTWSTERNEEGKLIIIGKLSAVAVAKMYTKKGVGKRLVKAAEDMLKMKAQEEIKLQALDNQDQVEVRMEVGVINARHDLFPWYQGQGYTLLNEKMPTDDDFDKIILPNLKGKIFCVKFVKNISLK